MNDCRTIRSIIRHILPCGLVLPLLLVVFLSTAAKVHGQIAAGSPPTASNDETQPSELSLEQFRALVAKRLSQAVLTDRKSRDPLPPPDLHPADDAFLELLLIQGKETAVHQSLERLSEWSKSIRARYQIQTAPQLDLDIARFVEARMVVESARVESEQARIIARANKLLGRSPAAPLVALSPEATAADQQAKEVLKQGEDMVAKMYESYQFGGTSITSLMEYENVLYEFDLEYRQTLARNAVRAFMD